MNFADGSQFSATAPQTTPLLTVSVPIGLQYGGTAGSIVNQSRVTNSTGELVGLQVQPGKTLALVGGNVGLDGGNLFAPGGRVELGGVAGAGTVGLQVDGNNLRLSFPDGLARADVSLTNEAQVNVRASGGGSIAINAQNLNIAGESKLRAGIASGFGSHESLAGDIEINVSEAITLTDGSFIANTLREEAIGKGGDIYITTGSLSVSGGAQLYTGTYGQGDAGSVTINVRDTASFDGENQKASSLISGASSRVESSGVGQGGNVNLQARSLRLTNGAVLEASTLGEGNAGSVNIHARDIVIDGERLYQYHS